MKKIMFNDKYGLTQSVLEGRKTMTRRMVPEGTPLGNFEDTMKHSRYKVGEVVAVAQCLKDMGYNPRDTKTISGAIWGIDHDPAWTNKMYVTSSLCLHRIRITNVRIERLQDISNEDCLREGIVRACGLYGCEGVCERGDQLFFSNPREAFAVLIGKISGKGTWNSNPWVFVYEFELVK